MNIVFMMQISSQDFQCSGTLSGDLNQESWVIEKSYLQVFLDYLVRNLHSDNPTVK